MSLEIALPLALPLTRAGAACCLHRPTWWCGTKKGTSFPWTWKSRFRIVVLYSTFHPGPKGSAWADASAPTLGLLALLSLLALSLSLSLPFPAQPSTFGRRFFSPSVRLRQSVPTLRPICCWACDVLSTWADATRDQSLPPSHHLHTPPRPRNHILTRHKFQHVLHACSC